MVWAPTRATVRDAVRAVLPGHWGDAFLNRLILAGIRDVASKTLCIERTQDVTITSGRTGTMSSPAYKIRYVEYAGVGLRKIPPKLFGHIRNDMDASSTVPNPVPQYYTPWDSVTVLVEPYLTASKTITVHYAAPPVDPTADGSVLTTTCGLPYQVCYLVNEFVVWMAMMRRPHLAVKAVSGYREYIRKCLYYREVYHKEYAERRKNLALPTKVTVIEASNG